MKIDLPAELRQEGADLLEEADTSELRAYCASEGINVCRVSSFVPKNQSKSESFDYDVAPFEPKFEIRKTPKLNCILFEQTVINEFESKKDSKNQKKQSNLSKNSKIT